MYYCIGHTLRILAVGGGIWGYRGSLSGRRQLVPASSNRLTTGHSCTYQRSFWCLQTNQMCLCENIFKTRQQAQRKGTRPQQEETSLKEDGEKTTTEQRLQPKQAVEQRLEPECPPEKTPTGGTLRGL